MDLSGKPAVITGAASGIGAETAKAMADAGADLILLDINEQGLKKQQEILKQYDVKVHSFTVDLTDYEAVQKVGREIDKLCDRIDILANIAGGGGPYGTTPIADLSKEAWDNIIAINLGTAFNCTKMVINKMIKQKSGKIINISSVSGVRGGPQFGKGAYATSKAAIIGFTQTLARELGPYGINVNAIAPGLHITPATAAQGTEARQVVIDNIPMKKPGDPSKLAKLILFLASDDNQYISGDLICVDGGLCMH